MRTMRRDVPGRRGNRRRAPLLAVAFSILGLALILAGCGSSASTLTTASPTSASTQASAVTTATTASQAATTSVAITDQAGRKVTIPQPIRSVYCTSPMGTNLLYTLAPEKLVGWNITPTPLEKEYIPEQYRNVIGLGGWFGKNTTGNVEEIIKHAPDVVLDLGTLDPGSISEADRIQGLLNIPVILIDGSLTKTGDAYRYIGRLLGAEARAEELAVYADRVLQKAQTNAAAVPKDKRVRVYYAEGVKGLNTDPGGSQHTEVLTLVGAENVALVPNNEGYGMSAVSLEQVIGWNPDVILVASDTAGETIVYDQITKGADWAGIKAVQDKRVYQIPCGPFDWFDRPPSIGRLLGVEWVGNLLYPDLYTQDITSTVKSFYELFYHFDLSDAQLSTLMAHALPSS